MLKGIANIISPELLKILMEMGHGDEIVIADGNFPSASMAQRLVRLDGHDVPEVLKAVLRLLPLDIFVDNPVAKKIILVKAKAPISCTLPTFSVLVMTIFNSRCWFLRVTL